MILFLFGVFCSENNFQITFYVNWSPKEQMQQLRL